ncbi:MAG: hypothetical protein ACM3U1_04665 [Chloroflexota bacterium]
MFETFIQEEVRKLRRELAGASAQIHLNEINSMSGWAKPYKAFFSAEIGWQAYRSLAFIVSNPYFKLEGEDSSEALALLARKLKDNAKFSREDAEKLLESAVKIRLNFLLRPTFTLRQALAGGESGRLVEECRLKLAYLDDYADILKALREKFNSLEKEPASTGFITYAELNYFIESIFRDMAVKFKGEDYVRMLAPAFEFFDLDKDGARAIPSEAAVIFFEDVGWRAHANQLRKLAGDILTEDELEETFFEGAMPEFAPPRPGGKPVYLEFDAPIAANPVEKETTPDADKDQKIDDELTDEELGEAPLEPEGGDIGEKPFITRFESSEDFLGRAEFEYERNDAGQSKDASFDDLIKNIEGRIKPPAHASSEEELEHKSAKIEDIKNELRSLLSDDEAEPDYSDYLKEAGSKKLDIGGERGEETDERKDQE